MGTGPGGGGGGGENIGPKRPREFADGLDVSLRGEGRARFGAEFWKAGVAITLPPPNAAGRRQV